VVHRKAESQMVNWPKRCFLAFGRMLKWPKFAESKASGPPLDSFKFVQRHRIIVRLRKNYRAVVKIFIFPRKITSFYKFKHFLVFLEILVEFAVFDHLVIRPVFLSFFLRPFELWPLFYNKLQYFITLIYVWNDICSIMIRISSKYFFG
jgi:hypothetical protein